MHWDRSATTTALLEGLFDVHNQTVWSQFDQRYRPVVLSVVRGMGLAPEDCADIAQETLLQFLHDYRAGKYDPGRGRLGAWILGIARHRVADLHRRKRTKAGGDSLLLELADEDHLEKLWDEQCQRAVLREALESLQRLGDFEPGTIQAFRLYAIENLAADQVAERMGMSTRAVYLAKHHCVKRLREIAATLSQAYELA